MHEPIPAPKGVFKCLIKRAKRLSDVILAFLSLRYDDVFIVGVHDVPIQSMRLIRAGDAVR